VELEQLQASVDGLGQAKLSGKGMDGSDASDGESAGPLGNFIMDVAGSQDGLGAATEVVFVEASLDASLAVGQFLPYALFHLKSLVVWSGGEA
jgi:hypothetical protein